MLGALIERDLPVLVPFGEGHPYDLVIQVMGNSFLRVRCKTARVVKGCLRFNSNSTDHGRGPGSYVGLADLFGVYCSEVDGIYLVPVAEMPRLMVSLRVEPTRNHQRRNVRYARDFAVDQWTVDALLGLAHRVRAGQLVETRELAAPASR